MTAVVCLGAGLAQGGPEAMFKVGLFLILPLSCIWFSQALGNYSGPNWGMALCGRSPGVLVCILGWMLLLVPVIRIFLS